MQILSEAQYRDILEEISTLMDSCEDGEEDLCVEDARRLDILVDAVLDYESIHYPIWS